jgi:hypothetical protein
MFESSYLGVDVVGFEVEVHPFFGGLRVVRALQEDAMSESGRRSRR